jgi:uncharacterized lipoprotein YddW (UPF0748 family)
MLELQISFSRLVISGLLLLGTGMTPAEASRTNAIAPSDIPPRVLREFRGAWISTISELSWPSKPGLPVAQQKAELRTLMEVAVQLRLNALILQVRPACDAVYRSELEPWSETLTGRMGLAPEPAYDPLQFAIQEAHVRGLELHAWFNPYRAGWVGTKFISSKHISKAHPEWIRRFEKYWWLDPGEAGVQDHVMRVVLDVVRRYDVDGIHLDDYFYPYADHGTDFPDNSTWKKYLATGGKLARADWRRENVNKLVQRLQREIHKQKSWVTFGISPFGIWRPGFPQKIRGRDAYESIYADSRKWVLNGWVDYLAPQLYWPTYSVEQNYTALYDWWNQQSGKKVPIWPGGAITSVGAWPPEEIVRQIQHTRTSERPGYIHWHMVSLAKNPKNIQQHLLNLYSEPALVPPNPRDAGPIQKPTLTSSGSGPNRTIRWSVPAGQSICFWVLQSRRGDQWSTEIIPRHVRSRELSIKDVSVVAISAVSLHRNISAAALHRF